MSQEIVELRKHLHRFPELSGNESGTAKIIHEYFEKLGGFEIIENVGGHGLIAVLSTVSPGPVIVLRAELDALPINESNDFVHRSKNAGISHKCGHDGHMAILCRLAAELLKDPPAAGKFVFLFQPSEETGEGAAKVLLDKNFTQLKPNYFFALHNLPGFPLNSVICRPGNFASASVGAIVKIEGKTSHAAHPENAINPILLLKEVLDALEQLSKSGNNSIITPIALNSGGETFGTSPAEGTLLLTLRTESTEGLKKMQGELKDLVNGICSKYAAKCTVEFKEEFYACVNDPTLSQWVEDAAGENNLSFIKTERAFRWSEDFGRYLNNETGVLFAVGGGENAAQLHNPDYDFPDEIIEPSVAMFKKLIEKAISHER